MKRGVIYGLDAQQDLAGIVEWYYERSLRAGEHLLVVVQQRLDRCREFPESAPVFMDGLRRVELIPFPLAAIYRILDDLIEIVAFIDGRGEPQATRNTLKQRLDDE